MPINYNPTTWVNNQDPPISADNLNHIEQGIKTTADRVDELVTVEANPSSSATDRLTGLEVDGTVYEVGGGHKVYTDDGTLLPQEPGLQFASGCVEDDAVNGKTIYIEMIRISQANYDTLKANGQLKPGAKYFIYDAQPVAVNADNLPYSSSQSTKQKIDEIVAGLTGWSTLETLYTDSGLVMKGATNSELKLAIIKLEGTANRPSVSGITSQLANKYKPFLTEPFARVRYGGDMWVTVSGVLKLSGMDTSQAWQNGFLMYPTR